MLSELSIQDLILRTTQKLKLVSDTPKLDVHIILLHVLQQQASFLYTHNDYILDTEQANLFLKLIAKRLQGLPVAYIIGYTEFYSLKFIVNKSTLIPRQDTEILIEYILDNFDTNPRNLLDLGTGTGAIALSIAHNRPNWCILGVDVVKDACDLARHNKLKLDINNASFIQGHWFDSLQKDCIFDIIAANPPYIDANDKYLKPETVQYEPTTALLSKDNGYADLSHIIKYAHAYLKNNGVLIVEHGWQQASTIRNIFIEQKFIYVRTLRDYNGHERATLGYFIHNT